MLKINSLSFFRKMVSKTDCLSDGDGVLYDWIDLHNLRSSDFESKHENCGGDYFELRLIRNLCQPKVLQYELHSAVHHQQVNKWKSVLLLRFNQLLLEPPEIREVQKQRLARWIRNFLEHIQSAVRPHSKKRRPLRFPNLILHWWK